MRAMIRVVRTTDEYVSGVIVKFEVISEEEYDLPGFISTHYTLDDAEINLNNYNLSMQD